MTAIVEILQDCKVLEKRRNLGFLKDLESSPAIFVRSQIGTAVSSAGCLPHAHVKREPSCTASVTQESASPGKRSQTRPSGTFVLLLPEDLLAVEECSSSRPPRSICVSTGRLSTQCSTLNFSAPVSLREKLLIPKERPEKGLSSGTGNFSLRDTELVEIEGGQLLEQI